MKTLGKAREIQKTEVLRTLIDDLLAEQKKLQTPVARFAEIHDREPDLAPHYRNLIPLSAPGPGEQYAFEVSLDRCTSCKACVAACHSLNGLDDDEAWRDTGLLVGGKEEPGWQQTITSACHHCADPGCMTGCPVGAYEKEADTGIVRHLDDQCIGCSYCLLKCPYDVPKYSKKRGIVRKCDMCQGRLAAGEAPACVQACPTGAIRIVKRSIEEIRAEGAANAGFLIGAPLPKTTRPSTKYVGRHVPTTAKPADQESLVPQHAHWPLVLMLTLTQAGLGLSVAASFAANFAAAITGAVLFMAGMAASILHLGRPMGAWRFFLGLRTSWLSREILAFSIVAPLVLLAPVLPFVDKLTPLLPGPIASVVTSSLPILPPAFAILSLIAVFTSVMIYVDTHRISWRFSVTATRFFGTSLVFAALAIPMIHDSPLMRLLPAFAILGKFLLVELRSHRYALDRKWSPDRHTARLQLGPLRLVTAVRLISSLLAVTLGFVSPWLALPLLVIAELTERQLFFQSVHAPKMPGGVAN
ncbi:MAG TPA: DmsC/YnfH family molybdoenzyme membrane anchor subunit [Luteolibacter sp.]